MTAPQPARSRPPAPDQPERDRIVNELDHTLFVEAGAGSGKTTALVDRVVALVLAGVELAAIAAITFTEKAAAELRDRVRRALEQKAADPTAEPGTETLCQAALDQLDGAAIGTLHSFAQRLLSEHPIEAGIPPKVEVLDEVSSGVEFERRWAVYRDRLLADPKYGRSLLLLIGAGVKPAALRSLAVAFGDNWDLVDERVPADAPEPRPIQEIIGPALAKVDEACRFRAECLDPADRLAQRLDEIADYVAFLRGIDDEIDLLEQLPGNGGDRVPSFKAGNIGRRTNFRCDVATVKAMVREAGDGLEAVRGQITNACAAQLGSAIRTFTLDAAAERRAAGRLEFHDLLVMARALLRDPEHGPAVRRRLHERYQRLLLDEFQDTDPIQIELAVRIAAARPESEEAGPGAVWSEIPVTPGHLFVVGDPKQSIYRFRRADISTFLQARDRFGPDGGGVVELSANFRSARPLIDWVNATFATLLAEPDDIDLPVPSQPEYVALDPVRPAPPTGPAVSVIGRTVHPQKFPADELRSAEAADVVGAVQRIISEQWSVAAGATDWRPARLGDITVLVPARTSLPFLEDALDRAGIAYRTESTSLVYATRAVRDLLMVVRAVDDPTNHLHIAAALRTPLLGCGDDDLFRFKVERRGRWSYLADQPDTVPADDPVAAGLAALRGWHDQRRWLSPSELIERIARDRRAFELGFAEGRPRDVWRRLRFVADQARAWSEATGGNLRQYLAWVEQQTAEGARVAESVLPETDDDAVRIMTIHAAKGLEFPVTIVSGMTTVPQRRWAPAEVVFPPHGTVGYKFGKLVKTVEYETWAPIDEQMGFHERIRLLYVACTRAKDHLVVSLHRRERAKAAGTSQKRTNAELLLDGMGPEIFAGLPHAASPDGQASGPAAPAQAPVRLDPIAPYERWAAERDAALAAAGRPSAVAATALTEEGRPDAVDPGLQKTPRDLDLPPWLKGRYGTAVGRAVHGVLQTIDLATGAGIEAAIAAQCQAEAIPDRAGDVGQLVEAARGSASVRQAAAGRHWREVYACTPMDGGRLLEGYVDLLYPDPAGGLVVVDYKTAGRAADEFLDRRVDGYRLQGGSYALAVAAATGQPVVRVTFVFLTPTGAVERHLQADTLAAAVAEVRAVVAAGEEVVIDSGD